MHGGVSWGNWGRWVFEPCVVKLEVFGGVKIFPLQDGIGLKFKPESTKRPKAYDPIAPTSPIVGDFLSWKLAHGFREAWNRFWNDSGWKKWILQYDCYCEQEVIPNAEKHRKDLPLTLPMVLPICTHESIKQIWTKGRLGTWTIPSPRLSSAS